MIDSLLYKDVQEYVSSLYPDDEDNIAQSIVRETKERFPDKANMLSGKMVGTLLQSYVFLTRPKRVVEVGTFTGYSAYYLLNELPRSSTLATIDHTPAYTEIAKEALCKHRKRSQLHFISGDATSALEEIDYPVDLSFIDANKQAYMSHYHMLKKKSKKGGVIIVDNTLFHGETLLAHKNKIAKAIHDFNVYIGKEKDVYASFFPIRDGLWVIVKK